MQDNGNSGGVFVGEYKPPFTITNEILSYVSSISEKIGRITAISSLETKTHLGKNNRIKSIHSSLKYRSEFSFSGAGQGCNQWQACIGGTERNTGSKKCICCV